jgi:hypothetical protein
MENAVRKEYFTVTFPMGNSRRETIITPAGVLAATNGVMNQAGRRLLPLDGHGQGRDRQFHP